MTALDFVNQVRREYRYEFRFQAIAGGTRHQGRSLQHNVA